MCVHTPPTLSFSTMATTMNMTNAEAREFKFRLNSAISKTTTDNKKRNMRRGEGRRRFGVELKEMIDLLTLFTGCRPDLFGDLLATLQFAKLQYIHFRLQTINDAIFNAHEDLKAEVFWCNGLNGHRRLWSIKNVLVCSKDTYKRYLQQRSIEFCKLDDELFAFAAERNRDCVCEGCSDKDFQ